MLSRYAAATKVCTAVVTTALLTGCAGGKILGAPHEKTGGVVGAVTGGVLGSLVPEEYRTVAILGGALIGAAIGSEIGRALDEEERKALEHQMALALNEETPEKFFKWSSNKSTASAEFAVAAPTNVRRQTAITRSNRVESPPPLHIVGEPYEARTQTSIYSGPRKSGTKIGSLRKGEHITAMGRVKDSPWIAVGKDSLLLGYVPDTAVVALNNNTPNNFQRRLIASRNQSGSNTRQPQLASVDGRTVDRVNMDTSCRQLNYKILKDGAQTEQKQVQACKTVDGHWTYAS